jgi:hypothetical protein
MTVKENTSNLDLCLCGCKQFVKRYFKPGHQNRVSTSKSWKGGRKICGDGYIVVKKWNHPYCDVQGYVLEHRLVMEKYLGRYLDPNEVIHHINKNKSDNRIENLMLFENHSKHQIYEKIKDMSDRICLLCKSDKTYIDKHGYIKWHRHDNGFICIKCYNNRRKSL